MGLGTTMKRHDKAGKTIKPASSKKSTAGLTDEAAARLTDEELKGVSGGSSGGDRPTESLT